MRLFFLSLLIAGSIPPSESIYCLVGAAAHSNFSSIPLEDCGPASWSCVNTTHLAANVTFYGCETNNCSTKMFPSHECQMDSVLGGWQLKCCCNEYDCCNSGGRVWIGWIVMRILLMFSVD